jgi:hypothetical protein
MSGENADPRDDGASIDEWRVEPAVPAQPGAAGTDDASEWSGADVSRRCAQVSADLSGWRNELNERIGRLEERLRQVGRAGD